MHAPFYRYYHVLQVLTGLSGDQMQPLEVARLEETLEQLDSPDEGFESARSRCLAAIRKAGGNQDQIGKAIVTFRKYAEKRIKDAGREAASDFDKRLATMRSGGSSRPSNPSGLSLGAVALGAVLGAVAVQFYRKRS